MDGAARKMPVKIGYSGQRPIYTRAPVFRHFWGTLCLFNYGGSQNEYSQSTNGTNRQRNNGSRGDCSPLGVAEGVQSKSRTSSENECRTYGGAPVVLEEPLVSRRLTPTGAEIFAFLDAVEDLASAKGCKMITALAELRGRAESSGDLDGVRIAACAGGAPLLAWLDERARSLMSKDPSLSLGEARREAFLGRKSLTF